MFEEINRELRECKNNILLKETLEEKLVTLEDTYYRKNEVLEGLEEKLNKEFKDVEKFNKISVVNIISTIFNYREEKLYKEEEEYLEAKLRYEEYRVTVEELKNDLETTKSRIEAISNYEERYEELIQEKSDILKGIDLNKRLELEEIEASINRYVKEGIEIKEAIDEAINCDFTVNSVLKYLNDASGLATWDVLGGGTITSIMKHDAVNSAKKEIERLGYAITKLEKELSDINMISISGNFNNIESSYLVDVFFDNIFTDISVSNKIDSSLGSVRNVKNKLDMCRKELYEKEKNNNEELIKLRERYKELVESYI
ncbi:hypothetical protein [Clostridium paraputrificum]|uniref:hypothetical protein n=1 Tax=Clostridium paraputrificum TaxID=29363 RepID=UPI0006C31FF1|nr:hypothetical protein [Clostridium paraputrificum]CUN52056.1 Uncharacterised protein [Clostridium paraputrificum]